MKPRIFVFMPARNEEQSLIPCIKAIVDQTLKPTKIMVINDGSNDGTHRILHFMKCVENVEHIDLPFHKESYVANPLLNWKMPTVLNHAFPLQEKYDYLMQHSPDTILPQNYIKDLIGLMEADKRLVVASGMVRDEPTLENHVRGVGRLYKMWFWEKYVKRFPLNYTYESFPLYKAQALGFKVRSFQQLIMETKRHTQQYKGHYGFAMRELGYFPPFAIMKCILPLIFGKREGLRLLNNYLASPFKRVYDEDIRRWLHSHQINRMLHFKDGLRKWKKTHLI